MNLGDSIVRLVPLREAALGGVWEAASTIEHWTLSLAPFGASREEIGRYVEGAHAPDALPFAVLDAGTGRVLRSTRLKDIDRTHRKAELGYTWYVPEVWGTAVNPACKLLMLEHAFGTLELERVYLNVNAANERSLSAVARLGAVREGVLRHDRLLADGTWRDTVVFSILAGEWTGVRDRLVARLAEFASGV